MHLSMQMLGGLLFEEKSKPFIFVAEHCGEK
jgi:hypothetical protein